MNDVLLRQHLLHEIAGIPRQLHPPAVAATANGVTPSHPFSELNLSEYGRRLDAFFNLRWLRRLGKASPACNLYEDSHEYLVTAHLPGVAHDQITVTVSDEVLAIAAAAPHAADQGAGEPGGFQLRHPLPDGVIVAEAGTEFEADLLLVHLPKYTTIRSPTIDVKVPLAPHGSGQAEAATSLPRSMILQHTTSPP